ncbi:MAG: FAD-dependent oxidoreductase [Ignavibacteriales bacterium]|nr:FAD-dependent oxidoreductase [Ignavibacteriales bacterium]
MKRRILVIGGVAAGPAAAAKAKRVDSSAEVILVESGEHISYGICELPYFIGGEVKDPGRLIVYTPERFEMEKGVVVKTLHRAESIHPLRRLVEVRDFERSVVLEIPYDRLIVATGSRPKRLGIAGEDARNVFTVKSYPHALALERFIAESHPRKAVIIGAGYIGMEMAESLAVRGIECVLIHRHDLPMWGLEQGTREAVAEELSAHGVRFVAKSEVIGFDVSGDLLVKRVRTQNESFDCDLVIVSIGVEPESTLAATAGARCGSHHGILTDRRQVTSVGNIYAAGDCCEVRNVVSQKWMYAPLATIAARQGRVAGENAAGGSAIFRGALRSIAVRVFSLEVARVGLSSHEAKEHGFDAVTGHIEANSRIPFFAGNAKVHVTTVAEKRTGRLLGANVYGRDGAVLRANTLALAIQQRLSARDLAETDLIYSPPFSPLWDPLLIAASRLNKPMRDNEKPDSD